MIREVPIELIKPNPFNERKSFDPKSLEELADNIKLRGFLGSLVGRKKGTFIELAFGSRRLKAAQKIGLKTLPVEVQELSDNEMGFLATSENSLRENVNDRERGKHIYEVHKKTGLGGKNLAKQFGLGATTINEAINFYTNDLEKHAKDISIAAAVQAFRMGGIPFVQTAVRLGLGVHMLENEYLKAFRKHPDQKEDLISGRTLPSDLHYLSLGVQNTLTPSQAFQKALIRLRDMNEIFKYVIDNWEAQDVTDVDRNLIIQRYKRIKQRLPALEEKMLLLKGE